MLDERREQLIQRCVDGELTSPERRDLLADLEKHPDGWKTVACSFMEEQLFAGAAGEPGAGLNSVASAAERSPTVQTRRHWFSHPITSVALSLCVAFLGGLLISDAWRQQPGSTVIAQDETSTPPANNTANSGRESIGPESMQNDPVVATLVGEQPNYSVRFEADGIAPTELPVYDDESVFLSVLREHQMTSNPLAPVNDATEAANKLHFLRLRLNGRTIVVPFEGQLPAFQ